MVEWEDDAKEKKESAKNDAETIEKVLRCRSGKKGGE